MNEKKQIFTNRIINFGLCIQFEEGYFRGSRSFRNSNPGNLRWHNQIGNIGKDKDGFAIFPDYSTGFAALCRQLQAACYGRSKVYSPTDTLYEFFEKYAPANDNNKPREYAERVAAKLNISPSTQLKTLLE